MEFTKQLPDTTDFGELIDNNCIYVDKTAIINQFASKKGPFSFLAQDVLVSLLLSIHFMNSLLMVLRNLKV